MNDDEREQWVNNDETLYQWWKRVGGSLRAFVRARRKTIDEYVRMTIQGQKASR